MFVTSACTEVVTILEAILLGANAACVDLGTVSLVSALGVFMLCVVAVAFIGGKLVRRIFPFLNKSKAKPAPASETAEAGYESPIKSTNAWRRNVG